MRKSASPELIQLLKKTLSKEEKNRWSIQQIKNSEFMNRKIDMEQVRADFAKAYKISIENVNINVQNEDFDNLDEGDEEYRDNSQGETEEINPEFNSIKVHRLDSLENGFILNGIDSPIRMV